MANEVRQEAAARQGPVQRGWPKLGTGQTVPALRAVAKEDNVKGANYVIVNDTEQCITIRDVGPWDRYGTVTNAVEGVVQELHERGVLPAGKLLLYYDSAGALDQLLHDGQGNFKGFAPAPAAFEKQPKPVGPRQLEGRRGAA